jgi:hypothetical protein
MAESRNSAYCLRQTVAHSNSLTKALGLIESRKSILPVLFIAKSQSQSIAYSWGYALDNAAILISKGQSNNIFWLLLYSFNKLT